jgi:hypothetical protein
MDLLIHGIPDKFVLNLMIKAEGKDLTWQFILDEWTRYTHPHFFIDKHKKSPRTDVPGQCRVCQKPTRVFCDHHHELELEKAKSTRARKMSREGCKPCVICGRKSREPIEFPLCEEHRKQADENLFAREEGRRNGTRGSKPTIEQMAKRATGGIPKVLSTKPTAIAARNKYHEKRALRKQKLSQKAEP